VANALSDSVAVLVGTPDGLAPPRAFHAGDEPSSVAVADFDGDDVVDLAVSNAASGDVSILHNESLPGLTLSPQSLDFTAPTGSVSSERPLVLASDGPAPLRVGRVRVTGADRASFELRTDRCS
jgi:hypothetical protein